MVGLALDHIYIQGLPTIVLVLSVTGP